ncbi:hypothetical protein YYC_05542, partial [Plasmodium yoelii 17X]
CQWFNSLWIYFPDKLENDGSYNFVYNDQPFKKYCTNSCDSNFEKINAACLYLFNAFFGNSFSFKNNTNNNIDVVDYIIIWLSYMLRLNKDTKYNNINEFYETHIKNNTYYNQEIRDINDYKSYKDLIDKKKNLLDMDINNNIISNFYKVFKLLYEMYYAFGGSTANCKKISSKDPTQFVEKYKELNEDPSITSN